MEPVDPEEAEELMELLEARVDGDVPEQRRPTVYKRQLHDLFSALGCTEEVLDGSQHVGGGPNAFQTNVRLHEGAGVSFPISESLYRVSESTASDALEAAREIRAWQQENDLWP